MNRDLNGRLGSDENASLTVEAAQQQKEKRLEHAITSVCRTRRVQHNAGGGEL